MPPLTLGDLPIVFGANQFRHYAGDRVFLIAAHPRNRPRVFYSRRLYTSPFVHRRVDEKSGRLNIENVLLAFPETESEAAAGVGQTLSRRFNVECEPIMQLLSDVKYYAGVVRTPLVVWLDPVTESSLIDDVKEIYYFENRELKVRR